MKQLPRIVLKGDRQAAEEMIREGVRQFDILLQQMKFAGLKQDVRRVRYLDGSEIVCKSVFGDNTLEIYVPPEAEEKKEVIPPSRGKFIVNYDNEGYLMDVKGHRIEMVHVQKAEFPTTVFYNTSIALADKAVDVGTLTAEHSDRSTTILEYVTARCGKKKVGLETMMTLTLNFSERPYMKATYAVKELDGWSTVYVATMYYWKSGNYPSWAGNTPFLYWDGSVFVVEARKYVWDSDRGIYKLENTLKKNVGYEDEFGNSDWYPTYLLYIDDSLWLHYNVCRFHYRIVHDYWQLDYVVYKQEKIHLLTGEQATERTIVKYSGNEIYAPAVSYDVYRHRVLPDGRLQVEHSVIESERDVDASPREETCESNWDEPGCRELSYEQCEWGLHGNYEGEARSDYFRATSEHRYSEGGKTYSSFEQVCTPVNGGMQGGPPYTWTDRTDAEKSGSEDFESEVKDYMLSGFEIVEEAHGSASWSCSGWMLSVLHKDPTAGVYEHAVSWEDSGSGGGSGGCKAYASWPDKRHMCDVECKPVEVRGEDYQESGQVVYHSPDEEPVYPPYCSDYLLQKCGFYIDGLPLWAVYFTKYGTFLPYRHVLHKSPYPFRAFFAVNGEDKVKMLEKYAEDGFNISELSVVVNEWDATAAFIKELERVTGNAFNVQLLYGIFAYVRAKDEQGLPS